MVKMLYFVLRVFYHNLKKIFLVVLEKGKVEMITSTSLQDRFED